MRLSSPYHPPISTTPADAPHRKQAVSSQTQELEALEARLRAAEERLNEAKSNSPPRRNDGKRRTPIQGVFPDQDKARLNGSSSPLGQTSAQPAANIAGALPETPSSHSSADYVLVERPSAAQPFDSDKA